MLKECQFFDLPLPHLTGSDTQQDPMKVPSRQTSRLMQGESFCGGSSAEEHARWNFRGQLKGMFTIVLLLVGPPARVKGDDRAKVTADLLQKRFT